MRRLLQLTLPLLLAALLLAQPAVAQTTITVRVDAVDASAFPVVHLRVSALDAQGRPLRGLTAENFQISESGRAAPAAEVSATPPDDVELRVVLALDISGSIKPRLNEVKQAAVGFIKSLSPDDRVAIVLFGDTARTALGFTVDHGHAINTINALAEQDLEEYTALYNGAFESVRLAAKEMGGPRVVVLLTDGKNTVAPNSTALTISDVLRETAAQGVPLYTIGAGGDISEQDLRLLSSSGDFVRAEQPGDLAGSFLRIGDELRQQYTVSYSSGLAGDSGIYDLSVRVTVPDVGTGAGTAALRTPLLPTPAPEPAPEPTAAPIEVQVTLPEQLTIGQPAQIPVAVSGGTPPYGVALLMNGEVVTATERLAAEGLSWTPPSSLVSDTYQLAVQITDRAGDSVVSAEQPVALAAPRGIPAWVWIVVGVLGVLLVAVIIAIVVVRRRQGGVVTPLPSVGPTTMPPVTPQPPTVIPAMVPATAGGPAQRQIAPTELANPVEKPRAMLVVERGAASLDQIPLVVGRDVQIGRAPGADLVLQDSMVSAQHARVRFAENGFTLYDLGSTNGTKVNGRRVTSARLQQNDRVEIGGVAMVYKQIN